LAAISPVIVCDDVDPVAAAATSALGKSPQTLDRLCVSPTRFFVEDKIYGRVSPVRSPRRRRRWKVGNGLDPANQMGPLANERRIAAMGNAGGRRDGEKVPVCPRRAAPGSAKSRLLLPADRPGRRFATTPAR